jgi:ribose transport system ATP-binding protein
MNEYSLQMKSISKEFPGVKALTKIDFDMRPGEVHALLGMNGAGKSTLIKILAGIYQKDSGQIFINGNQVEIQNPSVAKDLGISTVYQDPQMVSTFTGYENIFLGSETKGRSVFSPLNRRELKKKASKLLEKYPFQIDLNKQVYGMETVEKETIAVLRALSQENVRILVLDEPTSILTHREIKILFKHIEILKKAGISIIYITHRLEEVFEIADRFSVIRDGMNVGTYSTKDSKINHGTCTELMIGKKISQIFPEKTENPVEELLRLDNLGLERSFQNISLSANKGKILGVFGLVGSGFDELCKTLFGVIRPTSGKIIFKGKEMNFHSVRDSIKNGVFLIPGDRRDQGQISDESVSFNVTLSALDKISMVLGLVNSYKEKTEAQKIIDDVQIKTPSIHQKVGFLSGGNQQKVVIGKGLYTNADLYIFEEPTTGVDVGAKSSIYQLIRDLSKEKAVILVSSDCEEVFGLCDEVVVLYKGSIVLYKPTEQTSLEEMLICGLTGGLHSTSSTA